MDLKLKCKVKASNIHGIPLATDNKIVVRHRLYTGLSIPQHFSILSSTIRQPLHVLQCYRNLSARSGSIRLLRIGFGVYTATFRMSLRECMRIHAERARWQRFAHLLINDTERFPKLATCYWQPFCKASGLYLKVGIVHTHVCN